MTHSTRQAPAATWTRHQVFPADPSSAAQLASLDRAWAMVREGDGVQLVDPSSLVAGQGPTGWLAPLGPAQLGHPEFLRAHGAQAAYVVGAMANGITSVQMVEQAARSGFLAIFGAAGLTVDKVRAALARLSSLGSAPWGCNLIYTPHERGWEAAVVDLCLEFAVPTVCASAYLDLSAEVVRLRAKGLRRENGQTVAPRRLIVKLSRVELARKFMAPPPAVMLKSLVEAGKISALEAELAAELPVATDITVEADSGGHTDNRPSLAQFPAILAAKTELAQSFPALNNLRMGAAGGLGTPSAVAAAFAMGADYVVTGSVNQACIESGSSDKARAMLAQCGQADVAMAPAADMFEMGVKLQVLKRGTMFPMRAQKLYEFYREYPSFDALSPKDRAFVQDRIFRCEVAQVWAQTQAYWQARDPSQLKRAQQDPKHQMALLFRWYLGQASRWANQGDADRQADYQVWCGPAMGAFNAWAKGTPLAEPSHRRVSDVARALMLGAALRTRAQIANYAGLSVSSGQLAALERTLIFQDS